MNEIFQIGEALLHFEGALLMKKTVLCGAVLFVLLTGIIGCKAVTTGENTPSLVPELTVVPSPTSTPTPRPTNTPTPVLTSTPTPVPTNIPTLVPTNTPTPVPTSTPTPVPTSTPTPVPTSTPTPRPTNTPTPVPTGTPTPKPTNTPTPKPTSTPTPRPTNTPTPIPTSTPTPRPTFCNHEYEVKEVVMTATDYVPGVRRYICKQCGNEIERSYALPHSVDIGNGQNVTVYGYWDLEKSGEMLELLNEWRAENGIPALQDGNDGTARTRALECAYYYSHTRPNGDRCFSAFETDAGFAMAENIAAGYSGPKDVTNGWINSSGHNKNMLNSRYRYAVVSMFVVVDDKLMGEVSELRESDYQYKYYYVQNFWG